MGAEQAADVLTQIKVEQLARRGETLSAEEIEKQRTPILEKYAREGSPYYSTARLWDDGILELQKTRDTLGLAIATSLGAPIPDPKFGVFRM
jgi:acetyl-CoA carboxylase carboxyltransferase component